MSLYKPSELRDFLNEIGANPKKSLSQNFLIDGNIIRKIVETAQVTAEDVVIEIGPGPGALTEALLATGATVIAVEKDETLAKALERLKSRGKLEVFCEDILEFSMESVLPKFLKENSKAKVIANLPYHLTTAILIKFVQLNHLCSSLVLMVQDEVAKRYCATHGHRDYGSITLFLNFFSRPHYAFTVSNNCFFPVPKVQSAVVKLDLTTPHKVSNEESFFEMTRTAFKQRRKMLRASLKDLYPSDQVTQALLNIQCNPLARPEELSLQQFITLFENLAHLTI